MCTVIAVYVLHAAQRIIYLLNCRWVEACIRSDANIISNDINSHLLNDSQFFSWWNIWFIAIGVFFFNDFFSVYLL